MSLRSLSDYLNGVPDLDLGLACVVSAMASACADISELVAQGSLRGVLDSVETSNVQGETQKALDVIANDIIKDSARTSRCVRGVASEEDDDVTAMSVDSGKLSYLLLFDPLDGSSNIDVNISIGTIFSVLPAPPSGQPLSAQEFCQNGHAQVAAGYAVYGPQTSLVLTLSEDVVQFTFDPETRDWLLTRDKMKIPEETQEFAINMSNMRHWDHSIRTYIDYCLAGHAGPRGKDYNMRWAGSMVADVNRILCRGGIFLYPWDARRPDLPGKLRLQYEANPLSLIVERAGGASWNGSTSILDVEPESIHQRISVVIGSRDEVQSVCELADA